jgi:hypothetical protein
VKNTQLVCVCFLSFNNNTGAMAGHQIPPLGAPHGETDAVGSRLTQRMAAAMTLHDMDEDIQRLQRRQLARDPATANLHQQIAIDAYYQDLAASHCTCPPRVEFQPTARPFLSVHHEFSNVTPKVHATLCLPLSHSIVAKTILLIIFPVPTPHLF